MMRHVESAVAHTMESRAVDLLAHRMKVCCAARYVGSRVEASCMRQWTGRWADMMLEELARCNRPLGRSSYSHSFESRDCQQCIRR